MRAFVAGLLLGLAMTGSSALADDVTFETSGTVDNMQEQLRILEDPAQDWDAVVITFPEEDFLQFHMPQGAILLDFPLFTQRQRVIAPIAARYLEGQGIAVQVVEYEAGASLVASLGNSEVAGRMMPGLAVHIFGVTAETPTSVTFLRWGE